MAYFQMGNRELNFTLRSSYRLILSATTTFLKFACSARGVIYDDDDDRLRRKIETAKQ